MWTIWEADGIGKVCRKLPVQVVKKYELWKSLVRYNGAAMLREFKGFHDEALKGKWKGYRSSRLNLQFRVIYRLDWKKMAVWVEEINAHEY